MGQELLVLSDQLRDVVLPPLGVQLGDRTGTWGDTGNQHSSLTRWHEDGPALVKLVPPREATERPLTPVKKAHSTPRLPLEMKSQINPCDMFKPPYVAEGFYTTWDELGIPLTDSEGRDLSKNRRKQLRKAWEKQKARFEAKRGSDGIAWMVSSIAVARPPWYVRTPKPSIPSTILPIGRVHHQLSNLFQTGFILFVEAVDREAIEIEDAERDNFAVFM